MTPTSGLNDLEAAQKRRNLDSILQSSISLSGETVCREKLKLTGGVTQLHVYPEARIHVDPAQESILHVINSLYNVLSDLEANQASSRSSGGNGAAMARFSCFS